MGLSSFGPIKWTRLSCRSFAANAVRLQLHALAYNLGNFMRTLALLKAIEQWSLTSPREKLIKIGAKVVRTAATSRSSWPKSRCRKACSRTSCGSSPDYGRCRLRRDDGWRSNEKTARGEVRFADRGTASYRAEDRQLRGFVAPESSLYGNVGLDAKPSR
jgi:Transposase DDE domain group 1